MMKSVVELRTNNWGRVEAAAAAAPKVTAAGKGVVMMPNAYMTEGGGGDRSRGTYIRTPRCDSYAAPFGMTVSSFAHSLSLGDNVRIPPHGLRLYAANGQLTDDMIEAFEQFGLQNNVSIFPINE